MSKRTGILIGLILLYTAVRLWGLADACIWFDEIFSIHAAEHDWAGMFRFVAQDLVHPPLFYVLLKGWIGLGGEGVFWLRLLPVVFSIAALVPFLYLCRELKLAPAVVWLALLLFAVNGSLIKYTQTLRMYSLLMLLSLTSTWLFARYFNRGKSWIWLVIVNVLLVYTHYFGWMVVGAEMLTILIFQRIKIARALAMAGVVFASFIPWLITVWNAARQGSDIGQNIAWQPRPGPREVFEFLLDLAEPFYFQASNSEPRSIYFVAVPLLLIFLAAVCYLYLRGRQPDEQLSLKFLTVFAVFPILAAFVLSWIVPYSVWGTRHLIITTPIISLIIASALSDLPRAWARWASVALVVLLIGTALFLNVRRERPEYVWCAWDSVANDISQRDNTATIYALENLTAYHLWFAVRGNSQITVGVLKGMDVRTADESYFLPRGFGSVKAENIGNIPEKEFWLAFRTFWNGEEFRTIETFTKLGYFVCPPKRARFDANNVFWIKFTKDQAGCPAP